MSGSIISAKVFKEKILGYENRNSLLRWGDSVVFDFTDCDIIAMYYKLEDRVDSSWVDVFQFQCNDCETVWGILKTECKGKPEKDRQHARERDFFKYLDLRNRIVDHEKVIAGYKAQIDQLRKKNGVVSSGQEYKPKKAQGKETGNT